jgi:hypothetical protein
MTRPDVGARPRARPHRDGIARSSKGDVKKLAGEASLIRPEPIVLDWFSGKLFTAGSPDALNPTMALIAELVQARQTEKDSVGQQKSAAAKRNREREEAKKKAAASKESIWMQKW